MRGTQPGDPFCGTDPAPELPPDIPALPWAPPPATCAPAATRALGSALMVALQTAARTAEQRFPALLGGLGDAAPVLAEGHRDVTAAVRGLADDVAVLGRALAGVLRSYAELDGTAPHHRQQGTLVGSVIKKRRKRMAKKKHRKLLKKTRIQRRNKK